MEATTRLATFVSGKAEVFVWEAFVSGVLKTTGLHHDGARCARASGLKGDA
jgi:hypothetical protein